MDISETVCVGTSVEVFGTITPASNGNPISLYQIDDDPITSFTTPAVDDTAYRYKLYASPILPSGTHTINVTVLWSTGTVFWFDYLVYNSSFRATTDTTTHNPSVTSPLPPSPTSFQSTSTLPINASSLPHASSASTGHLNAALVAGVTVTTVVSVALLVTSLIVWVRRRNKTRVAERTRPRPFTIRYPPAGA